MQNSLLIGVYTFCMKFTSSSSKLSKNNIHGTAPCKVRRFYTVLVIQVKFYVPVSLSSVRIFEKKNKNKNKNTGTSNAKHGPKLSHIQVTCSKTKISPTGYFSNRMD